MTTATRLASPAVPPKDSIDMKTRLRIAAKLRYLKWEGGFETNAEMADELGIHKTSMGRYLSGGRTVGLDVLLLVHRKLHVSIDWMVDRDPPADRMSRVGIGAPVDPCRSGRVRWSCSPRAQPRLPPGHREST